MILGKFKASFIPLLAGLMGYLSIILCYYISQWLGQEKPFPHTWISKTADHYPEYIIFRIGTISGAVFIILAFFINHFTIQTLAYQNTFNIGKYKPKLTVIFGTIGALFLMGSTANLDTGKQDGKMHQFCAANFFIFSILATLYNSYIYWILYSQTKCVGKISTYFKIVLSILIIFQALLDTQSIDFTKNFHKDSNLGNIIEYTAAFSILGHMFCLAWDVKNFSLVYDKKYD